MGFFSKVDFKDAKGGHVPEKIERIARQVSSKCKGFPLTINVIASSMIGKSDENEWNLSLRKMEKSLNFTDPIVGHPCIDQDLFQQLKWSYDCLPASNFKIFFLYSVMFPQATAFSVNPLVQMWMEEGLVKTKYARHNYVQFLENW